MSYSVSLLRATNLQPSMNAELGASLFHAKDVGASHYIDAAVALIASKFETPEDNGWLGYFCERLVALGLVKENQGIRKTTHSAFRSLSTSSEVEENDEPSGEPDESIKVEHEPRDSALGSSLRASPSESDAADPLLEEHPVDAVADDDAFEPEEVPVEAAAPAPVEENLPAQPELPNELMDLVNTAMQSFGVFYSRLTDAYPDHFQIQHLELEASFEGILGLIRTIAMEIVSIENDDDANRYLLELHRIALDLMKMPGFIHYSGVKQFDEEFLSLTVNVLANAGVNDQWESLVRDYTSFLARFFGPESRLPAVYIMLIRELGILHQQEGFENPNQSFILASDYLSRFDFFREAEPFACIKSVATKAIKNSDLVLLNFLWLNFSEVIFNLITADNAFLQSAVDNYSFGVIEWVFNTIHINPDWFTNALRLQTATILLSMVNNYIFKLLDGQLNYRPSNNQIRAILEMVHIWSRQNFQMPQIIETWVALGQELNTEQVEELLFNFFNGLATTAVIVDSVSMLDRLLAQFSSYFSFNARHAAQLRDTLAHMAARLGDISPRTFEWILDHAPDYLFTIKNLEQKLPLEVAVNIQNLSASQFARILERSSPQQIRTLFKKLVKELAGNQELLDVLMRFKPTFDPEHQEGPQRKRRAENPREEG